MSVDSNIKAWKQAFAKLLSNYDNMDEKKAFIDGVEFEIEWSKKFK